MRNQARCVVSSIVTRQLRIEFEGAFYHVTSRGNERKAIFLSDRDRLVLLDCLQRANRKFGAMVHCYCLMDNHYHALIETPRGNLSRIMHFINTAYTIYFNKKHEKVGHLFQGRFKAILLDADTYARQLSRYIHLNPVRRGKVDSPEKYLWSSFREYAGHRTPPSWLITEFILGLFAGDLNVARHLYMDFVLSAIAGASEDRVFGQVEKAILGSDHFVERIKNSIGIEKHPDRELPALGELKGRPPLEMIRSEVEAALGWNNKFARNAAISICRENADYKLREIGDFFGLSQSAIAIISDRFKKELSGNDALRQKIEEINRNLFR